jgi:peptide/nickel transport system permease protein
MIKSMLLRRLAGGLLMMWLISVLVFVTIHLLPGDAATTLLGHDATPEQFASLNRQLGLDRPLLSQYGSWMSGLLTGHWGTSLVSSLHVSQIVGSRMLNTAVLTVMSMAVMSPLAIVIGVASAVRNGRTFDNVTSIVTLCLSAIPPFAIGVLVIYFFATNVFHWLPAASVLDPDVPVWSQLNLVAAPALAVVFTMIPYPIRMVRAAMIEVLQSEYIMLARLKGLPERQVIFRHALRNGLGPIIQALGLTLLFLSGGIIVIETVFSYPGIGYALVQGVEQRDVPVVQTIVVLLAAVCVLINLGADLAVASVTPRLRTRLR